MFIITNNTFWCGYIPQVPRWSFISLFFGADLMSDFFFVAVNLFHNFHAFFHAFCIGACQLNLHFSYKARKGKASFF